MPLLLAPGCATVGVRVKACEPEPWTFPPGSPRYVYPAVAADVRYLLKPFGKDGLGGCAAAVPEGVLLIGIWAPFAPFMIVDLPISFATDTLFLPYDLYMVTWGGKTRSGEAKKPPEPARGRSDGQAPGGP